MNAFPKLFDPIEISGLRLRNRIVKAPMCTNYSTPEGFVTPEMIAYYRERAWGGAGLVVVEFAYVDDVASKSWPRQLGVESDGKLEGLSRLADAIRAEGAAAALQICHCGVQRLIPGGPPRVPSASAVPPEKEVREADEEEIERIVAAFADAAVRTERAGFDLVEIHAAHGYLLSAFLSPDANRRTDAFGGDLEGRLRFPRMVVGAVRRAVGKEFPVAIRMNGSEMYRGGLGLADACAAAREFAEGGVDLIHVSAGTYGTRHLRSTPMYARRGNLVPLAAAIRKVSSVPVIASGGLSDPEKLEAIVREGRADMVSLARQLHAEPHWARKVREGRVGDIRPCIRCNAGCLGAGLRGERILCDINPETGREAELEPTPAVRPKRVAVIGGGPAGMEAARVLCLRGHIVTLYEARDRLGGALIPAACPDFKADLRAFLAFQERQLEKLPMEIRLNTRIRAEDIANLQAEEVVVATGTVPKMPAEIAGCAGPRVMAAVRALMDEGQVGRRVVVVGGGITGCETAWHLARQGREVTLLEAQANLAPDMEGMHRPHLLEGFERSRVRWRVQAGVTAVANDGTVHYRLDGTSREAAADTVVLAVGVQPERSLAGALSGLDIPIHEIGDCASPGRIFGAVHDGARVGRAI
ncbi:MAG: FAD-dependent oxidoreductase [Nitrospinota bacterium]